MSVAGFDIGDQSSCIAVARKRGIDVLMNKVGLRSGMSAPSCLFEQAATRSDAIWKLQVHAVILPATAMLQFHSDWLPERDPISTKMLSYNLPIHVVSPVVHKRKAAAEAVWLLCLQESKRETASVLAFNAKQRLLGTDAVGSLSISPRNAITQLKRFLGKKFNNPDVQVSWLQPLLRRGPTMDCRI